MRPRRHSDSQPVAPFHPGRKDGNADDDSGYQQLDTLFRPHVFQYKCRGILHMPSAPSVPANDGNSGSSGGDKPFSDIDDNLPLCKGLQSKMNHLTTLTTVSSKDEAIEMFENVVPPRRYVAAGGLGEEGKDYAGSISGTKLRGEERDKSRGSTREESERSSVSCYGSTDVNVLVVEKIEVPVPSMSATPWLVSPMGSMFGPKPMEPFSLFEPFEDDGSGFSVGKSDENDAGRGGVPGGLFSGFGGSSTMKSVSSSTSIVNGKSVTTKETVTVGPDGKRHVQKETIVRKRDGTMERTVDGGDSSTVARKTEDRQRSLGDRHTDPILRNHPFGALQNWHNQHPQSIKQEKPEVVAILPEFRLGVTVANVEKR